MALGRRWYLTYSKPSGKATKLQLHPEGTQYQKSVLEKHSLKLWLFSLENHYLFQVVLNQLKKKMFRKHLTLKKKKEKDKNKKKCRYLFHGKWRMQPCVLWGTKSHAQGAIVGFVSLKYALVLSRERFLFSILGKKQAGKAAACKPRCPVPPGLCMDSPSPMDPQKAERM